MKNVIGFILITLFFVSCSAPKTIFDGKKYVTEKQHYRDTKRTVNKVLKQMSKEERQIILGSKIKFNYNKK